MATTTAKALGTAISPEYIKDWTVEMGIRELLQNAIDTKKQFNCHCSVKHNGVFAEIIDDGPGIEIKHLALGISDKGENAIGQFGEGLKLALLLFAREGRTIEVRSNDFKLTPALRVGDYNTETLFFDIEEGLKPINGTKIRFYCSAKELDQGKRYFPVDFRSSDKITWVVKDKISLPGGRLYVNGSMVANITDALFSYHVYGEKAKKLSNRDRTIIDANVARDIIREELFTEDCDIKESKGYCRWFTDVFETFKSKNSNFFERRLYPSYSTPALIAKSMRKAWDNVFGKEALLVGDASSNILSLALRLGRPAFQLNWDWEYILKNNCGVQYAVDFMRQKPIDQIIQIVDKDILMPHEHANLETAIKMISDHYYIPENIIIVSDLDACIGISEAAKINGKHIEGLCQYGNIYIVRRCLDNIGHTVKVLLHETVHQKTEFLDLSPEFQSTYDNIASGFLMKLCGWV
jgi:hypothetical protein